MARDWGRKRRLLNTQFWEGNHEGERGAAKETILAAHPAQINRDILKLSFMESGRTNM